MQTSYIILYNVYCIQVNTLYIIQYNIVIIVYASWGSTTANGTQRRRQYLLLLPRRVVFFYRILISKDAVVQVSIIVDRSYYLWRRVPYYISQYILLCIINSSVLYIMCIIWYIKCDGQFRDKTNTLRSDDTSFNIIMICSKWINA